MGGGSLYPTLRKIASKRQHLLQHLVLVKMALPDTKTEINLRFIGSILKHALLLKEVMPNTRNLRDDYFDAPWKYTKLDEWSADVKTMHALGADVNTTLAIPQIWVIPGQSNTTHRELTGLHVAIKHNDHCMTCKLLEFGANIGARDSLGYTPLHYAVMFQEFEVIYRDRCYVVTDKRILTILKTLFSERRTSGIIAVIETPTCKGMTPFLLAASVGNIEAMDLLLQHGANMYAKDVMGQSALHHLVLYIYWAVSEVSRYQHGRSSAARTQLVHQYSVKLVEMGLDPKEKDTYGICALDFYPYLDQDRIKALRYDLVRADLDRRRGPYLQVMRECKFVTDANERRRIRQLQETMDTSCPLEGISRETPAQNHAYLVSQVFSQQHVMKRVLDFL